MGRNGRPEGEIDGHQVCNSYQHYSIFSGGGSGARVAARHRESRAPAAGVLVGDRRLQCDAVDFCGGTGGFIGWRVVHAGDIIGEAVDRQKASSTSLAMAGFHENSNGATTSGTCERPEASIVLRIAK